MAEAVELKRDGGGATFIGSLTQFATSTVGSKVLMALTGLGLWLFVIAHLAGNLTAFAGRDVFNHYALALKGNAPLLWGVRLALIVGFPIHIFTALRTVQQNRAARPVQYAYASKAPARAAAKYMMISGALVLVYFLFHLAHFTWHVAGPQPSALLPDGNYDAYTMLVLGFKQPFIALFYVVAQILLAAHLSHAIHSLFQHLGLWGAKWTPFIKNGALLIGYGLCAAFASIPLAVLLGFIKP